MDETEETSGPTLFDPGERVVYPRHGVGTVTEITDREVDGETTAYLCVDLDVDLVVWLPVVRSADLGLRRPVDRAGADAVLALLCDHEIDIPRGFRSRYKRNQGRLASGELSEVARVVRELAIRASRRRLSPTECRQQLHAHRILEGELATALGIEREEAAVLVGERVPEPLASVEAA